jgi:hypothetical protein
MQEESILQLAKTTTGFGIRWLFMCDGVVEEEAGIFLGEDDDDEEQVVVTKAVAKLADFREENTGRVLWKHVTDARVAFHVANSALAAHRMGL